MKLVNIGFGSAVSAARILSIVSPESAPIKRVIQEARERGMLIDASFGRKTKSLLADGHGSCDPVLSLTADPGWQDRSRFFCR